MLPYSTPNGYNPAHCWISSFPGAGIQIRNQCMKREWGRYNLCVQGLCFKGHWARTINLSAQSYKRHSRGKLHAVELKQPPFFSSKIVKNIYIQNRQEKPSAKKIGDFYRSCFCKKLPRQQVTKF